MNWITSARYPDLAHRVHAGAKTVVQLDPRTSRPVPALARSAAQASGGRATGHRDLIVCGPQLELDVAAFGRAISRRPPADGLLATEVPF